MRTMPKPHNPVSHLPLAALILLGASLIAAACGGDDALSAGSLALVPDDSHRVVVVNVDQVLRGDVPEQLEDQLEDDWEDDLEDLGVSVDYLTTLVIAYGEDGRLVVLEGEIDFEEVRDELDDADYADDRYQGYEVWEEGRRFVEMVALLEDRRQIVIGDTETVEDALKTLNRRSGSLQDDADSDLGRVLSRAGEAWVVSGREGCWVSEVRGCIAAVTAIHRGDEDYVVEETTIFLFRSERTAESEMDDLEDEIDDNLSRDFDIEEVRLDGEFVFVTVSVDEDDWDIWSLR